jgi:hypothetical protein
VLLQVLPFSTSIIGGVESIIASSTMIESSPTSIKTKRVTKIIWYLHSKKVDAFILKIKVSVMCNNDKEIT